MYEAGGVGDTLFEDFRLRLDGDPRAVTFLILCVYFLFSFLFFFFKKKNSGSLTHSLLQYHTYCLYAIGRFT